MPKMFVCELCKTKGADFRTPVDEIGSALMEQHLISDHNLSAEFKGNDEKCEGMGD